MHGVLLTIKWCPTCNLYRPPRATHCGICDNCVSRFDHHCPYVGNCVGIRNYRYFLIFIFSTFLMVAFGTAHCVSLIVLKSLRLGFVPAYFDNPVSFVGAFAVGIIAFITTVMVGVLVVFTSYMISSGRTTNENIKTLFAHSFNPWDDGCIKNWFRACCPPTHPATVFPREYVWIPGRKKQTNKSTKGDTCDVFVCKFLFTCMCFVQLKGNSISPHATFFASTFLAVNFLHGHRCAYDYRWHHTERSNRLSNVGTGD